MNILSLFKTSFAISPSPDARNVTWAKPAFQAAGITGSRNRPEYELICPRTSLSFPQSLSMKIVGKVNGFALKSEVNQPTWPELFRMTNMDSARADRISGASNTPWYLLRRDPSLASINLAFILILTPALSGCSGRNSAIGTLDVPLNLAIHSSRNSRVPEGQNQMPELSIPSTLGWFELPNSSLAPNCPDVPSIQGAEGCQAVIADWGGGLADTRRNRLVVWGGGHNGYYGNELYALNLNTLTMQRLTDPSDGSQISNLSACPEAYMDGNPNSRHTYNGLQYLSKQDLYFMFGAGLSPCGNFTNVAWVFNPVSLKWIRKSPKNHPNPAQNGSIPLIAYDRNSGSIYEVEANTGIFWKYDVGADNWTDLGHVSACARLNLTSAIDPIHGLYFCVGNGVFDRISLRGSHAATHLRGAGCSGLVSAGGPGFDFDSSLNRMVGWAGTNTVYVYDPETDVCSIKNFNSSPGHQQQNGTFGRFRYFPELRLFAVVNDWKQNAYVLRLTPPASALQTLHGSASVSH
jgi:hypothetical protein